MYTHRHTHIASLLDNSCCAPALKCVQSNWMWNSYPFFCGISFCLLRTCNFDWSIAWVQLYSAVMKRYFGNVLGTVGPLRPPCYTWVSTAITSVFQADMTSPRASVWPQIDRVCHKKKTFYNSISVVCQAVCIFWKENESRRIAHARLTLSPRSSK